MSAFAYAICRLFCNALFVFTDGVPYVYFNLPVFNFLDFKEFAQKNPRTAGLSSTTTFITLPPIKSASQGCKADAEYDDDNRRDTDYKAVGKKHAAISPKPNATAVFPLFR